MLTINLDLDGVLANFDKRWQELEGSNKFNRTAFRNQIMENNLFQDLEPMPEMEDFKKFISLYKTSFQFQILSSLGSPIDTKQANEASRQKKMWLLNNGFDIPAIFVHHKGLKRRFATPVSILVDDTKQNIWDFEDNHGVGIHYDHTEIDPGTGKSIGLLNLDFHMRKHYLSGTRYYV